MTTVYRCILPSWAALENPTLRKVQEGLFSAAEVETLNLQGYNIYYLPNSPKIYDPSRPVAGSDIDEFNYIFIDCDLKDGVYATIDEFITLLGSLDDFLPSRIVVTGNGVHAYWKVSDLDAMSYLRLSRRMMRLLSTDSAVGQIYQLMRYPGTVNQKDKENPKLCEEVVSSDNIYTCEQLDAALPLIAPDDETFCQQHYQRTYNKQTNTDIDEKLPLKFSKLLDSSPEVKDIWTGNVDDRSKADYRLAHIMFASGFSKKEAMSVLVNAAKALSRAPQHRVSYAQNIIDKIWTYEITEDKTALVLSNTVREILNKHGSKIKGVKFPCWSYLDATDHGFRLGQVIGLVAGSGVGKTAIALNMFEGFVENNPDYDHFFVPLEQPAQEIADRWKTMCGDKTHLYDKVHIISNYDDAGAYRNLSFDEIKEYILKFQEVTGRKVGCIVIDHIGALKKQGKRGENQDLMDICHQMKGFAVQTNTLLVMQSQAPREKAGSGDLELNKDAAYGTVFFESYCDYLISLWQPVKSCYSEEGCPTVTAFKFCKIRHKKKNKDVIQEDVRYTMLFDSDTERLRPLTETEEKSFDFFLKKSTNARKLDRKTDLLTYKSAGRPNGKADSNKDAQGDEGSRGLS